MLLLILIIQKLLQKLVKQMFIKKNNHFNLDYLFIVKINIGISDKVGNVKIFNNFKNKNVKEQAYWMKCYQGCKYI